MTVILLYSTAAKFVLNGVLFEFSDLIKKGDTFYSAKLKVLKKEINYEFLYNDYTTNFVDRLN